MNRYLSDKLRIISLISMIMVVFIHSYNLTTNFNSGNINIKDKFNVFTQDFFSEGITRIAVPIFFIISGYLFFLKHKGTAAEFLTKFRKRSKSVLLPYLLWSIWGVIFYLIMQNFPQSKNFFTDELIMDYSLKKLLDTIFINPIPYQLWFLRDLIVLIVISPIIYSLIKYFKFIPIILLFIIWIELFNFNFIILSVESVLFFYLGAYLSIVKTEYLEKILDQKYYLVLFFLWILMVFCKTFLTTYIITNQNIYVLLLHKSGIVVGLIALWSIYDVVMKDKSTPNKTILNLSAFSFFVYAFHEPTLTIIKKGAFYILGNGDITALLIYFISPIITIILSILVGSLMKKITPKTYELITGGR